MGVSRIPTVYLRTKMGDTHGWENILIGLFDLALVQSEHQNQIEVILFEGD